jgi:hypothetical protein
MRDEAKADVFDYIERFYNANAGTRQSATRDAGGFSLGGCQPNRVQATFDDHCLGAGAEVISCS